ncbi:MAG: hypothetical protein ACRDOO_19210 [Actinomadura sp.]
MPAPDVSSRERGGLTVLRLAVATTLLVVTAACGGAPGGSADPGLTGYQGDGFTVGYPRDWRRDDRYRVFRGADAEAYVIRMGYSAAAGQGRRLYLRQVDLFVRVSPGSVIDVRMVFLADRYEPARRQIDAVLASFRVRT